MEAGKTKRHLTVVTNSEVQTFLDCRRKWGFGYVEGLRPKTTPRALSFGQAFHAGTEALYRAIGTVPVDEVEGLALETGSKAIAARFSQWVKECEEDPNVSIDSLYEDASESLATAQWMLRHYVHTFRGDITRIVPLGVELPFSIPMRNSIGRVLPHLTYAGVFDLVAYDPEYGDIVLYDHKTTSSEVSSIDRRVELDPQMGGYLNALVELLRTDDGRASFLASASARTMHPRMKEAVDALESKSASLGRVSYNVVRKKRPSQPKINKDGTVSVAAIDTLPEYYEAALDQQQRAGKPVEEKQRELLAKLRGKGDSFIGRREFFRTKREIDEWRAQTFEKAREMRAAERDPNLRYRNPGNCSMPWSMQCVYRSVCLDDAPENRASFVVSPRHLEVEEARKRLEAENAED